MRNVPSSEEQGEMDVFAGYIECECECVTAAILVSQNNETAAMLVSQTNPLGVVLFSYENAFFCSYKFAWMLAT